MKRKITENERANHNRAITLLILGLFVTSWVMINAGEFIVPAILYVGLGLFSVFLYLIWDKF